MLSVTNISAKYRRRETEFGPKTKRNCFHVLAEISGRNSPNFPRGSLSEDSQSLVNVQPRNEGIINWMEILNWFMVNYNKQTRTQ